MERLNAYRQMINIVTSQPVNEWQSIEYVLIELMKHNHYRFVAMLTVRMAKLAYAIGMSSPDKLDEGFSHVARIKDEISAFTQFLIDDGHGS